MADKKIPKSREQKSPTVPAKKSAPSHGGTVVGGRAPMMKPKANNTKGC
jgi:hypothetical protein